MRVDDLDAALARIERLSGVHRRGEPEGIRDGPLARMRFAFVTSPCGINLELVERVAQPR